MTTLLIPPGTIFGRWTVTGETRRNDRRAMLCRCECGTTKTVYLGNLTAGQSTSCGCKAREDIAPGTVFGHLAVIEEAARSADGSRRMLCECECGNQVTAFLGNLRRGRASSCGCHGVPHPALSGLRRGEVPLYGAKAAGRVALIDDADYDLVMQLRWNVQEAVEPQRRRVVSYATTSLSGTRTSRKPILMHKLLTGWPLTDHIDGNGLNNRRSNLRPATHAQNQFNAGSRGGSSQYKGVSWNKHARKWCAGIDAAPIRMRLGYFTDEEEAARAYDAAALQLHGEFARLNFPVGGEAA